MTVGFISLGCAKNLVDSQILAGFLKQAGVELAAAPEVADIILVNTCAFIEAAREEAAENILAACEHKRRGGCKAVVVAGCMVARYRDRLRKAFPDVDAFLGIDDLERIPEVVEKIAGGKRTGMFARKGQACRVYDPAYPTLLFTGGPFAYLKVADGCNHRCAYCAIPLIRGNFRSRPMDSLLTETRAMVKAGVREINLIAQDVLRYGCDLARNGKSQLPQLLRKIDRIEGDFRWRLLYGYPSEVSDEILELLATSPHACKYLDLPVQHSHPDILRAMNRTAAIDATAGLVERLRKQVPGITVRTTCLVGFPGETETHFKHLLDYVKASQFDHLGVFAFSPEEGTPAEKMDGVPAPEVADARCAKLMRVQRKIARDRALALTDTQDTALLLRKRGKNWIGRTSRQAPDVDGITIISNLPETAKTGDFATVTITGVKGYDLTAKA
ncbi:MAG: 30S ribosomal protein S12 methylthiotransferase RimO [Kiritimatiellae bacterium]|nr:30S ribosomal protein S12 methylthiotransferase RimO [Kiritimatiellia bacterium]